ncbi:MAG TPA: hypothetical protein VHK22_06605 [Gaiellaceae bacterium]|nr:hypothetical protein [Gaiellaceae bacterium]
MKKRIIVIAACLGLALAGCGGGGSGGEAHSAAYQKCYDFARSLEDTTSWNLERIAGMAGVTDLEECDRGVEAVFSESAKLTRGRGGR